jgi:hypothetical protein
MVRQLEERRKGSARDIRVAVTSVILFVFFVEIVIDIVLTNAPAAVVV